MGDDLTRPRSRGPAVSALLAAPLATSLPGPASAQARATAGLAPQLSAEPAAATAAALSETEPAIRGFALALRFVGANADVELEGRGELAGKVNYLIGNDPARWRTGLPTYQEVV